MADSTGLITLFLLHMPGGPASLLPLLCWPAGRSLSRLPYTVENVMSMYSCTMEAILQRPSPVSRGLSCSPVSISTCDIQALLVLTQACSRGTGRTVSMKLNRNDLGKSSRFHDITLL